MSTPRLEAMITVPTGGWAVSVTIGATTKTSTVPAGTYYMSSPGSGTRGLEDEITYQLDTDWSGVASFYIDMTPATELYSFGSPTTFSLTWTSTSLRDEFGYADALTPAGNTFRATKHPPSVWFPKVNPANRRATVNARGAREAVQRVTRSWTGEVVSTVYNRHTVERFTFRGLTKARTWIEDGTVTNGSAEQFWADCLSAGRSFRYYTDEGASATTTYLTPGSLAREYKYAGGNFTDSVRRVRDGSDKLWEWTFEGLVEP